MKELQFKLPTPFGYVQTIGASASEAFTKSIYLGTLDNTRKVKATITASGTWAGTSLAVKFVDSADDSSYGDVTDGDFAALTEDGSETIEFTLGSNVDIGTGLANYGKFLKLSYASTGGDSGDTTDVDFWVEVEDVFVPNQETKLGVYYKAPA